MKNWIKIFPLIIIFSSDLCSQWFWQNPLPQGNSILSISFPSELTGYLGTYGGAIVKTTDGGTSWTPLFHNINIGFGHLAFYNNNVGIAGSAMATQIARTTDGGLTWTTQSFSPYDLIASICILNDSCTYAGSSWGQLYQSSDMGITWILKCSLNPPSIINCWYFITPDTGILTNTGRIYRTTNGGLNWELQYNDSIFYSFSSIAFNDQNTGLVVGGGGNIRRTTNGGTSWDSIYGGTQNGLNAVMFLNSTDAFAVANATYQTNSIILRSTNSGLNWTIQNGLSWDNLKCAGAYGPNTVFAGGENGRILKYHNGDTGWTSVSSGFSQGMCDIKFFNNNLGYALANPDLGDSYARLVKTTNGGLNWTYNNINATNTLSGMSFIDANTGYVVGWSSQIYRTTNGGLTWADLSLNWQVSLNDVFFVNANTGFTVGSIYIYKTTNAGVNWSQQILSYDLKKIYFPSQNTGFITSGSGSILKTTDCGTSWTIITSTGLGLDDIFFYNDNTGWAAGGRIIKTTNGGENWVIQYNSQPTVGHSINFVNENIGYAAGSYGAIVHTSNGGTNWYPQDGYTSAYLTGVYFTDSCIGWIVGYYGVILHTTNGGISLIQKNNNYIPRSFSLSQNYPNPFNPNTKIKFQIAKSGLVKLLVFDVLGREIATLVNEQSQPGTYEAEWDGTNYPSGVYFYKLITPEYTETRKMVLVK
jgi:photosystem II stability/assembly factor-like uncharacterized protein